MTEKVFHSFEQVREHYFPEEVQKERDEERIKEVGWGKFMAEKMIAKLRKALR